MFLVCAAFGLFATWIQFTVVPALKRARAYSRRMQQCGQLAPPPTPRAMKWMHRVSRFFVRGWVGKLEVTGHEKLATMPGPFLLTFNHGSLLDVAIAPLVLNRPARYPAAQGVMKAFGGLNALMFAPWGVFSVDLDNGAAAFEASVNVVAGGEIEVIFPEAWTNMDGKIGRFKTGSVRIAAEASKRRGEPVMIVPGYMHYGRYLPSFMTKWPIPVQWLTPLLLPLIYRRGCKVVIGEPISSADLPEDANQATEILKQKIVALKPVA